MIRILAGFLLISLSPQGMSQNGVAPVFEVISVKPSPDGPREPIGLFTYPGGRIRATRYTLAMLISSAYDVEMHQITGGPAWTGTGLYTIEAKPPESSPSSKWIPASFKAPPNPEMRLMLQNLLADRFGLRLHRETKSESVLALVVAKGGPKLTSPKDATQQPFVSFGRTGPATADALSLTFVGKNATMDQFVQRLSQHFKRPVLNRTGLGGSFDFVVEYGFTDAQLAVAPPLDRAIQEQAGLKLERQPGSIELLVIDDARKPSSN